MVYLPETPSRLPSRPLSAIWWQRLQPHAVQGMIVIGVAGVEKTVAQDFWGNTGFFGCFIGHWGVAPRAFVVDFIG